LFEVAMLVEKKRVRLKGTLQGFLEGIESRLAVLPMDSRIAADAVTLELPEGDPFDRLIVATARRHGLELLSRDKTISKSGLVNVVW
jgi:PIN domain nuclease of toxin-antitoxin system